MKNLINVTELYKDWLILKLKKEPKIKEKKYKIKSRLIISSYKKDIFLLDIKKKITKNTKTKLTAACPIQ